MISETISVMIPCYNSSATLPRALASLIAQSHQNWEALIIDDGSTDHPEKVVEAFSDPRLRYFRHSENKGRAQARELALQKMQGDYLTMLDADDWLIPEKFTLQMQVLKDNPQLALVSSGMFLETVERKLAGLSSPRESKDLIIYPPLKKPRPLPIPHAPILVRREALKNRHYDISLNYSEDLDFFLPILMEYSYALISRPLYTYAYEENRSFLRLTSQLRSHRKIFAKYFKNYPLTIFWRILITFPKNLMAMILYSWPLQSWWAQRGLTSNLPEDDVAYLSSKERVSEVLITRFREPTGA